MPYGARQRANRTAKAFFAVHGSLPCALCLSLPCKFFAVCFFPLCRAQFLCRVLPLVVAVRTFFAVR